MFQYLIKIFTFCFILISSQLSANPVDISKYKSISLMESSSIYIDKKSHPINKLITSDKFTPYSQKYLNRGISSEHIWIKFTLSNTKNIALHKILIITSTLLEDIVLYQTPLSSKPLYKGVNNICDTHITLHPFFPIHLEANSSQTYYMHIHSNQNPVDFALLIDEKQQHFQKDRLQQFVNILLIGMVLSLMLYSLVLAFYTKDKSYFYYSLYLFTLMYQQLTYLGLTQLYFPLWFIHIDIKMSVFKVGILIITASLYAMHFLKKESIPKLYFIYKIFIYISFIEIIIFSFPMFANLELIVFTGTLFIIFNLYAGIKSYSHGNKQARLFVLGFSIVFISYMLMILDALGFTSIMQNIQNILMVGTALEALILSLAFADRYMILRKEKEKVDTQILTELHDRTTIIGEEVIKKTEALKHMVETKELLLQEVHHRVKNNLQIILSIIRLQNDEINDRKTTEKLNNLENRINAISKTYEMLLVEDNIEQIDMEEYIDSLLNDISNSYRNRSTTITLHSNINATIPLKESVYVGLIINELVTNTYKYAFDNQDGDITISLTQENNHYILIIEDNGKGYNLNHINHNNLGLKLIHTLIYNQLGGEMEQETHNCTKYTIRFTI